MKTFHLVPSCVALALALALACFAGVVHAQDDYDNIAVGATVQENIGLGIFTKPLPLPEGQWKVVARNVVEIPLVSTTRRSMVSEPAGTMSRHVLTLRNSDPNAIMPVIVLSIMGRLTNLDHGVVSCPAPSNTEWVDQTPVADGVPVCARTLTTSNFRAMAAQGVQSTNSWVKANLGGLTENAEKLPNNITLVDVAGNAYRGYSIKQTYILRQEGNLNDSAYANYLKPWVHDVALAVRATLQNEPSKVSLPRSFTSAVSIVSEGTSGVVSSSTALADSVPLKDVQIANHFDFIEVTQTNFREALFACIPNFSNKSPDWPLPAAINSTHMKAAYAKIFLLRGTQGLCLNRSATGFPIFAADSFLLTDNPVGVPDSVASSWYQKIAENVAKQGSARVAYVFKNKNAIMVRYWVDPSKPVEINYQSEFKRAGGWESKDVDFVFESEGLNSVTAASANASGYGKKSFPF